MKARLFINGYFLGEIHYEHPKNEEGKTIPLPQQGEHPGELQVLIQDENDRTQLWASKGAPLEKLTGLIGS